MKILDKYNLSLESLGEEFLVRLGRLRIVQPIRSFFLIYDQVCSVRLHTSGHYLIPFHMANPNKAIS